MEGGVCGMSTMLSRHVPDHTEGPGAGFLVGIILVALLVVLFFMYAMPGLG